LGAEIRALIVDDELLARRGVRQLLAAHPDVAIVGECRGGREALRALDALQPNLVFLDVQMPEIDGFDVLRLHGPERMPTVVFVTAHDEFAVNAFEAHALDYLIKPLSEARFNATMDRVRERMRLAEAAGLASKLAALLASKDSRGPVATLSASGDCRQFARYDRRIVVRTQQGELLVDVAEIDWIEAEDYYVRIHAGKRDYLVRTSIASLADRLDPKDFAQVHRSAILRVGCVRELVSAANGETAAILRDGTRVPVSRRRREQFAALFRDVRR
jgi:two-component system LytT family response regulator